MNKISTAIMAVMVLLLAACQITVQQPTTDQLTNTISVDGSAQFKTVPDEATIGLHVETDGKTAQSAQDSNSRIMAEVQKALRQAGVRSDQMETVNYNLYPNYYWNPDTNRQVQDGFKASHMLRVKTTDLGRVGDLIQLGVNAGASRVDSINFGLSDKAQDDAQAEALRRAVDDARGKADALAQSLGVRVGKVARVSISNYYVTPMYRGMADMAVAKEEFAPVPPIAPQEVDVNANVQVVFEIA